MSPPPTTYALIYNGTLTRAKPTKCISKSTVLQNERTVVLDLTNMLREASVRKFWRGVGRENNNKFPNQELSPPIPKILSPPPPPHLMVTFVPPHNQKNSGPLRAHILIILLYYQFGSPFGRYKYTLPFIQWYSLHIYLLFNILKVSIPPPPPNGPLN